jgi:drug/metabolite transporter (DMT)-like permease
MSARGWTLFAAMSVIWGVPYLFIKVAVDAGLTPGFLAWSRVMLAAVVLLPIAYRNGALRGMLLGWVALFAVAEIVVPFVLIGFGEQRIASSLTAILIAALPLAVALLALRFDRSEELTATRLVGMLIGFAGVAALVGIDLAGADRSWSAPRRYSWRRSAMRSAR